MGNSISQIFNAAANLVPQLGLINYIAVPATLSFSDVVSDDELPSSPDPNYKPSVLSDTTAVIKGTLVYIPAQWTHVTIGGRLYVHYIRDSFSGLFSGTEDSETQGGGGVTNTAFKVVITHSNTAGNAIVSVTQTGQPSLSQEVSDTKLPVQVGLFKEVSQNYPVSVVHETKTIILDLQDATLRIRILNSPIVPHN